jgi:hypothetical protein
MLPENPASQALGHTIFRAATTANSLKRCIISLFTTSTGVRFLFNLAIGTASGNVSGD